jgi:hypothetical protein
MINMVQSLFITILIFFSYVASAQEREPADPFFGAKDRKPKKAAAMKAVSSATDDASTTKTLAAIGIFICLAGGIALLALGAHQANRKKAARKNGTRSKESEGMAQKFKLNEPYSDSKNLMERMVQPIKRATQSNSISEELQAASSEAASSHSIGPATIVDGRSPLQSSGPASMSANLNSVETTDTGSLDVLESANSANSGGAERGGSLQPEDMRDVEETVTSPQPLRIGHRAGGREAELQPRPDRAVGYMDDTTLEPATDPKAESPAEFDAITETKPRLISADSSGGEAPHKKRRKPTPGRGGSDVA